MENPIEWWRWALLILLFGALFGAWLWVNKGKLNWKTLVQPTDPKIKVLEKYWVSGNLSLFLIEVKDEQFLLARTPGSLSWQKLETSSQEPKNTAAS